MEPDEILAQARRILMRDDVEFVPGPASHYRARMDFVFFPGGLGLREPGSHDRFVDIRESDLAVPRINELLAAVRERFVGFDPFDQRTKRGGLRYCVIRSLDTASVSFVVNPEAERLGELTRAIESFVRGTSCENVLVTRVPPETDASVSSDYDVVKGSDLLEAELGGAKLFVHAQGFFQNDVEVAEKMHVFARDCLLGGGTLVDLYGGVGAFACSLGSAFERAIVIEDHEGSAALAQRNLEANGIAGEAIAGDATLLARFDPDRATVVTDPPRTGMSERAMRSLARMRPERVLYVSCNPLVLPRDLAYLRGYSIERACAFDLFPGTDHFELVVSLVRS